MNIVEVLSTLGLGTFIGTALGYEYRQYRQHKREQRNAVESWFNDTLDVVGRGAYNIGQARIRSEPDYDRILEDLDGFSERLYLKARNHPDEIPDKTVDQVGSLAEMYAKATSVAEANSQKEGFELLSELFEMAQKESYEEFDLEEAVIRAADISGGFSQIIDTANEQGVDTEEFANAIEGIIREWDSEDFVHLMSALPSDGKDSVGELTNNCMNIFFELAQNLSNEAYEALEAERRRQI